MIKRIEESLNLLIKYCEREKFKGYDPYDILNSFIPFYLTGKLGESIAIQIGKRFPINFRTIVGIKKEFNPKGIGLFLHAYSLLYEIGFLPDSKKTLEHLFNLLIELRSPGYNNFCWGYNFIWANPKKKLPKFYPSIVVTSIVIKGIYNYYKVTKDKKAFEIINSATQFVLNELPLTENEHGICFSYTNILKDTCFNASLLGAEILAIMYSLTGKTEYLNKARQAIDFVIAYQKEDGRWNYSIDLATGKEDKQIDFHQGFIIDSIRNIMELTKINEEKYKNSILSGANFYYNYQVVNGEFVKYRYPKIYPIDIHNQAQSIITFSNLSDYNEKFLNYAQQILIWTIENMQDKHHGFFYYRKGKFLTNKISFIRWGQAWMLLAISTYLSKSRL